MGVIRHLSILLVLALVSCTKSSQHGEIVAFKSQGYSTELKAVIRDGGFVEGDKIAVMGYYVPAGENWENYKSKAVPEFMYNQELSLSGGMWHYSPKAYWPSVPGSKINFYSYFPHSLYSTDPEWQSEPGVKISAPDAKGEPSFDFVLSDAADIDLMVAVNEGCSSATGPVDLEFHHVLGKLQFKFAVSNEGGFSYIVDKIRVLQTPKRATYTWDDGKFTVQTTQTVEAAAGVGSEGVLINSTEPKLVEDFTMFLMPGELGTIEIIMNNEAPAELDLSELSIVSGQVLTVTVLINLTDISFSTRISDWLVGGTVSGNIN